MAIDAATRESLELTISQSGARKGSLLDAVDRTVTGAGARLLGQDVAAPLMDRGMIEARLDLVQRFHDDPGLRDMVRGSLRALPDIGRALGRLAAGAAARATSASFATASTVHGGWASGSMRSTRHLLCSPSWCRSCAGTAR
jgi:DNA mismatch repair ATPase MutS